MFKKTEQTNSLNVLVVEDDTDIARLIEAILQEMGIKQITRTRDGRKALSEFVPNKDKYQIVISDWEMPEMNGLELLKEIRRASSKSPDQPCLLICSG
jgi:two-component system chemotaxis response regulator CheY